MIKDELQQILKTQLIRMTDHITNSDESDKIQALMKTQSELQSLIEHGVFLEDESDRKVNSFLKSVKETMDSEKLPIIPMRFQITFTGGVLLPVKHTKDIPPYININEQIIHKNKLFQNDLVNVKYQNGQIEIVSITHSKHANPSKFVDIPCVIKEHNNVFYVDSNAYGDSLLSLTNIPKYILPDSYVKSSYARADDIVTLRYDKYKNYPSFRCVWLDRLPR